MALTDTMRPAHLAPSEGRRLRVITDLVTVKATTADTGGVYALIEARTPTSGGCPLHSQRYDDATYVVLAGSYRFRIGDADVELGPGGYAFVPRGTAHGYVNAGDGEARMLALATPGGVWERFLAEIGDSAGRAPWEPDVARVLAVAPKYGIEFQLPAPDDGDTGWRTTMAPRTVSHDARDTPPPPRGAGASAGPTPAAGNQRIR